MNLAIFHPRLSYFVGGSERVALQHIEHLIRDHAVNIDVYTVSPPHTPLDPEYIACKKNAGENAHFHEVIIPESYRYIYEKEPDSDHLRWDSESLLFSRLVAPLLEGKSYDCLLTYYLVDALFKPLNIPNAVYLGGFPREEIPLYRSFIRFCDAVLANSEHVLKNWDRTLAYHEDIRKYVLKKGVDTYNPKLVRNPFERGTFNILYVGRLIERKGVHILLEAFKQFVEVAPSAHAWIIGDGPERTSLEAMATHSNIHFMGTRFDAYDYYAHADMCVFPSLVGEGMMTTVCEAMMCGACVIATTDNGNESFIEQEVNGVLVPPGDVHALVKSLQHFYQNAVKRKALGEAARRYAREHFSWIAATADLYRKLVEIAAIHKT